MKKSLLLTAFMLLNLPIHFSFAQNLKESVTLYSVFSPEGKKVFDTRFGKLEAKSYKNNDGVLFFNNKPIQPTILANNSININQYFQVGNQDIALVEIIGGSGCPAEYHLITLTSTEVKQTPSFGTCSDLVKTKLKGNTITISMPEFNSGKKVTYTYKDGILYEDKKPVK